MLLILCSYLPGFGQPPMPEASPIPPLQEHVVITDIEISGNSRTQEKVILRELSFEPGQSIRADSINALIELNKSRLATSALFTDYQINIDTLNPEQIKVGIVVKERWYIWPEVDLQLADRNFNVWWKEHDRDLNRAIIGLRLNHRNFRGRNERLVVTSKIGYRQEFSVSYVKPNIDREQRHGLGFLVGVSKANEIYYMTDSNKLVFHKNKSGFITNTYQGSVSYSYRPAYSTVHQFRLTYKHTEVADTVLALNQDYILEESGTLNFLELSYRVDVNKTDNWHYPLRGSKLVAQTFALAGLKGMDFQGYATLEAGHFRHLKGKWYTSAIFRGKISLPEWQPYILREALGNKYNYIRGYEYYVIDGSQFGLVRTNLKHELLNVNLRNIPFKYLPVLPVRIYPKVFSDVGYVYNRFPGNSFLNNKMLYSAGLGVDIFTAYDLKVRVEYAINHMGQKGLFLHFVSE